MNEPYQQYELDSEQNTVVGGLARQMRRAGGWLIAYAGIQAATAVVMAARMSRITGNVSVPAFKHMMVANVVILFAVSCIYGLVGTWTRKGSGAFSQVVETKGKDITHLMDALELLRRSYNLIYRCLVVVLVLMAGWFVFGSAIMASFMRL